MESTNVRDQLSCGISLRVENILIGSKIVSERYISSRLSYF